MWHHRKLSDDGHKISVTQIYILEANFPVSGWFSLNMKT